MVDACPSFMTERERNHTRSLSSPLQQSVKERIEEDPSTVQCLLSEQETGRRTRSNMTSSPPPRRVSSVPILDRRVLLKKLVEEISLARQVTEFQYKRLRKITMLVRVMVAILHITTLIILTLVLTMDDGLAANILGLGTHTLTFVIQSVSNLSNIEEAVAAKASVLSQYRELDRDVSLSLTRNGMTVDEVEYIYENAVNNLALIESRKI